MSVPFTPEQQAAIERSGGLLLTANAGSGKTSVMAERFVLAARVEDGDVARILAITFTEKAAAELKTRVRARFEQLGDDERARATEGAWISTIHSFCARLLRTHALAAGIDPRFAVLDERAAERLTGTAFDAALDELVDQHGRAALALIAAYRPRDLRAAIVDLHGELRSRGEEKPALPPARPAPLSPAHSALALARAQAAVELEVARDGKTVARAREVVAACAALLDRPLDPPPAHGEVTTLALPRNGAALAGPGCAAYRAALDAFADACADVAAVPVHALFDALLRGFSRRYAEAKHAASALDFEDLELRANRLLREHEPLRARYAERFQHVMVDEFQDTNPLQLELLERIAGERLFAVGDELQSIYGFRHADVRQFRTRREALAEQGATATLATNFRSHRELLEAFNFAFVPRFDASFVPLVPGREEPEDAGTVEPAGPRVELLVTDSAVDWSEAGLVPPGTVPPAPLWRIAEAKLLAARVRALLDAGRAPGDIVLLLRATGDLATYERALVELGIPTYVIGGRGYWAQQQVRDLTAYLSVLANPRDGTALMTVLASPLVGLSSDGLVQLAAATRAGGEHRDSWWTLTGDETLLDRLDAADRARVETLRDWLPHERRTAARYSLETLLDRVLARTGYDLTLLRMEGGARRMANVRKLMRLAREHEAQHGRDLRGFVDLVGRLVAAATDPRASEDRESEAPVEGEALDAVRLMTIHRAKGLEFPVVCVADLGRESPSAGRDIVRVGRDGRVGIRLKALDGSRPRGALAFRALGDERLRAEADEEARLFYVAMTRAREHLVLSGAARCETWPEARPGAAPLTWIGPAFVPDISKRIAPDAEPRTVASHDGISVAVTVARPSVLAALPAPGPASPANADRAGGGEDARAPADRRVCAHPEPTGPARSPARPEPVLATPPVAALSYTSLQQHAKCGYRFYLQRVLGLPPADEPLHRAAGRGVAVELDPRVRGRIVHSLLERLDFARPMPPDAPAVAAEAARAGARLVDADAQEIAGLVAGFLVSDLCIRLAALKDLRPEQPFSLRLDAGETTIPLVGVLDAVGREGERVVVVDYKSDRVGSAADLDALVSHEYGIQRAAYALAALRDGATEVEVVHVFLERPDQPASATFRPQDVAALTAELAARADTILQRAFPVAPDPGPRICDGCPGRGSLCSWPLERTLDVPEGRLF
ncbi:MAG TPA: UvrD-helicase domain-containing protein [Conexibacter sp.]|nr:UvrD-helicase domain-containing protein [Conexibacter sp.]